MKGRIAVSAALAIAVALGTAGCGLLIPQSTTQHYVASDGSDGQTGAIKVRNALLITGNNGADANLVVTLLNSSAEAHVVLVKKGTGSDAVTKKILVKAGQLKKVGSDGTYVLFRNLSQPAGSLLPLYFQTGDEPGTRILVPVLTGALYPDQVPNRHEIYQQTHSATPTPNPTFTAQPLTSATPNPTATPTG